jgi:pyruvate kinase
VARHRPAIPIVAPAASDAVRRQLALVWGVQPVPLALDARSGEDRLELVVRAAFVSGAVRRGARVVLLAEHALEGGTRLPTVRVVRVGEDGRSLEP